MNKRRGFTLVEMLIVAAVIALLIGLLLPAVQLARESAARTQCQNNAKQIALACLSYEATHAHLPSGGAESSPPGWSWQGRKWMTDVNPHLEQRGWGVALLRCPSKSKTPEGHERIGWAACDREQDGLVRQFSDLGHRIETVRDGMSHTLLIAELWCHPHRSAAIGFFESNGQPRYSTLYARTAAEPPARDGDDRGNVWGFGGPHRGGLVCAFGDGSVRVEEFGVEPGVWKAHGTRAAGDSDEH